MRKNSVVIKSCAYGIVLLLDPDLAFEDLLSDVAAKFREAARFFRNAQMAVSFHGRVLTEEEEFALISTITANSNIHIVCIVDESKESADFYKDAVVRALEQGREERAAIYYGTLTNGQRIESENSILILGDVNPGASVTADGHVIILGCCMGNVCAGFTGKQDAFVAALVLKPSLIRIAGLSARPAIVKKEDKGEYKSDPMIAWVQDGHLQQARLNGAVFTQIMAALRGEEG